MKYLVITLLFGFLGLPAQNSIGATAMRDINLMPWPAHIQIRSGRLRISKNFHIAVLGHPANRMYGGATRLLRRVGRRTGIFFEQARVTKNDTNPHASLVIQVHRPGVVKLGEDESYRLVVSPTQVRLTAEDDIGALHGLQTLMQLVRSDRSGYYLPAVVIKDRPRFPWRGLMIDVARHFEPVSAVERNLDGMAAVKLNVLHLHLTDSEGFRIQSKTFPKLTGMGSHGEFYSQQQMKKIIAYADNRGIRVVPEFDLPGHSATWFIGYPQYASAPGPYHIVRRFGHSDATFDPTNPNGYRFLDRFFKEMAALFPDKYIHIGGDENNGVQWRNNPGIQAFMQQHRIKDTADLQTFFERKLAKIISGYGKNVIGWDEILQPGMPRSAVIQSWRGKKSLYKAARKGHPAILSSGYYLDHMRSAAHHYENDPIPPGTHLAPKVRKNILGGEVTMWSELVRPTTIDSRIWPRTAAIAERFWSPARLQNANWMYQRLHTVRLRLEALGLTHIKNQNMLLRQLAGQRDIQPLKILAHVIEPLKGYRRILGDEIYTTHSPLASIADAATADAPAALEFNRWVKRFAQSRDADLKDDIRYELRRWQRNAPALEAIIERSPALHKVQPVARSLAKLAGIGLRALHFYERGRPPPKQWLRNTTTAFIQARQAAANVTLQIVDAVEKLVVLAEQSAAPTSRTHPRTIATSYWQPIYQGVDYTAARADTSRADAIRVDLTAPGIGFETTPASGALDTVAKTTSQFLLASGAKLAINGNFFSPYYRRGTTPRI